MALCAFAANAQERNIRFFYVVHDHTTPIADVTSRLEAEYTAAMDDEYKEMQTIFYLPNGSYHIVVKINTSDDNHEDFYDKFLAEIYERNSHEVDADADVQEIVKIFNDLKLDDPSENVKLSFSFIVTPLFWRVGNNEGVISNLFYTLDLANVIKNHKIIDGSEVSRLTFEVRYPRENPIKFNATMPFGVQNLGGINQYMKDKIYPL